MYNKSTKFNLKELIMGSGTYENLFESFSSEFLIGFIIAYIFTFIILIAFLAVIYVFGAIASAKMLKSLGHKRPWLAWIPLVNSLAMGQIADYYDNGRPSRNFGKKLFTFAIVELAAALSMIFFALLGEILQLGAFFVLLAGVAYFVLYGIIIAYMVNYYFALWAIYRIFAPDKSVLFLVISILTSYPIPFFLFAIRNNVPQNVRREDNGSNGDFENNYQQSPENPYRYYGNDDK